MSLTAESTRLEALIDLRRKELDKAAGDFQRRRDRKSSMAVSEEELSHARDNLAIARMSLRVAQEDLRRNNSLLLDTPLREQPLIRQNMHQMREAWLALQRCTVKSPVDGVVARRSVQAGMHVAPGTPLMAVVPLHAVWVDANFKEVQIARMRIGQPALVEADMYGGKVVYSGVIAGFSAGTGSSFSLLPPENATGNWIKVVQRVPVKIALPPEELRAAPLLVGLSCAVRVDVRDASGDPLAAPAAVRRDVPPVLRTSVLQHDSKEIDDAIEAVIRSNAVAAP